MTIELEITTDGALGRITLNRPQAINALSLEMILASPRRSSIGSTIRRSARCCSPATAQGLLFGRRRPAARALVVAGTPEQRTGTSQPEQDERTDRRYPSRWWRWATASPWAGGSGSPAIAASG